MKKSIIIIFLVLLSLPFIPAPADSSDISGTFLQEYNALTPREYSSVQSDYLFEQIALGSRYTILLLDQIKTRTDTGNDKIEKILEKLDTLIQQNQEIIKLLSDTR
jgi:Tfp pilus assembly protein PilN